MTETIPVETLKETIGGELAGLIGRLHDFVDLSAESSWLKNLRKLIAPFPALAVNLGAILAQEPAAGITVTTGPLRSGIATYSIDGECFARVQPVTDDDRDSHFVVRLLPTDPTAVGVAADILRFDFARRMALQDLVRELEKAREVAAHDRARNPPMNRLLAALEGKVARFAGGCA